jgi:hypothetical protein
MKSESAPFSQWASGIQWNTVKREGRSSRMHSESCNLPPNDYGLSYTVHYDAA